MMKKSLFLLFISVVLLTSCITVKVQLFDEVQAKPQRTKINKDTVLHFDLSGHLPMYAEGGFRLFGGSSDSAHEIMLKINSAKTDKRINAILLQPQGIDAGYATLSEIKTALLDFKTSGKKVYGYLNVGSDQDLFLLSVADEVYMNPSASAGFVLSGMSGTIPFFKDFLDKIGAEAHIIRAGEYKGAGEPFTRTEMSDELRSNLSILTKDGYEQLLADMATGYEIPLNDLRYLYEERENWIINLDHALTNGIIDDLQLFDTMLTKININEKQLVKHTQYTPTKIKQQKQLLAIVYMNGNIASSGSSSITSREYGKLFDDLMKNDKIKAVVLRINSGGGSALESEIIYTKINQLKEKKPVIVSLGGTAASGGYYIATNANYIFANPYTITGSIGVFGMLMNLKGTADKIGVNFEQYGLGKFSNAGNLFMPFDEEFTNAMQVSVNDVYHEFKTRVSEGRNLSLDEVEAIAQGQVWSAQKALEYKLVDEIGLLTDAINKAIELSGSGEHTMLYYPTQKSFMSAFMSDFNVRIGQAIRATTLPNSLHNQFDNYLEIVNDVIQNPIQMRSEIVSDRD